jgi:hypothetical protein
VLQVSNKGNQILEIKTSAGAAEQRYPIQQIEGSFRSGGVVDQKRSFYE